MFKLKVWKYLERGNSSGVVSVLRKEGLSHGSLTQLHQLVVTELGSERYARVQLLIKSLEKLCEDNEDLQALLNCGIISKLLCWYKSIYDTLTCDLCQNTALMDLTEAFFDYFLELAKASVPVTELRVILMYLSQTALESTIIFRVRLEAIRTFNSVLESVSREQRRTLQTHDDMKSLLSEVAAALFTVGDYELQACLSEALCRLTPKRERPIRAKEWFSLELSHAFSNIHDADFEADCRHFLNVLNSNHGDQRRVYTFSCLKAFLDTTQLFQPEDDDLDEFWIDFNLGSERVCFFIDNPNGFLWECVQVPRTEVIGYSLTEACGVSVVEVDLINSLVLKELRGLRLKLEFKAELHSELISVIGRVFKKLSASQSFMRTYHKKRPRKKPFRVLPLSSPSSEEDSVVKSSERSRAEILFDQVIHSTPVYSSGLPLAETGLEGSSSLLGINSSGKKEVEGSVRKRPMLDSGYMSDHTSYASPILRRRESPKERAEHADEWEGSVVARMGPPAEWEESKPQMTGPAAEWEGSLEDRAEQPAEWDWSVAGRVEQPAEWEGSNHSEASPIQRRRMQPTMEEEGSPTKRVEPATEWKKSEAGRVEAMTEKMDSVRKKLKEWSAEGVELQTEEVELQVTKNTASSVCEPSTYDITASFKSHFEQQLTSHWQQVENTMVKYQQIMSELLSAVRERRARLGQMLENNIWNWKELEDFSSINSSIMSFLEGDNLRVMSFCQQLQLRLKSMDNTESEMGAK